MTMTIESVFLFYCISISMPMRIAIFFFNVTQQCGLAVFEHGVDNQSTDTDSTTENTQINKRNNETH